MPQLSFLYNNWQIYDAGLSISDRTLSFFPFQIWDSISFKTLNIGCAADVSLLFTASYGISLGLYSLNGSTLSLANSISGSTNLTSAGNNTVVFYVSLTDVSATQNITPGTWWFGCLIQFSMVNATDAFMLGAFARSINNAFPGGFVAGRMTESTAALPNTVATSNLDITGADAFQQPFILLSS